MIASDGSAGDPTASPAAPPEPNSAPTLPAYPGAEADDRTYLAYLRAVDAPRAHSRFPLLPFAFMLVMALLVAGLGFGLLAREAAVFSPRETSGADADAGGGGRAGDVPFCDGVTPRQEERIVRTLLLMQRTREGERLVGQLASHEVCIGVDDLDYNAAYASGDRTWTGDWDDSTIVIDEGILATAEPDVLAALLVHEATHIDRFIRGKGCGVFDGCEVLDNGVVLEEEVAAHGAEAQWWISMYGPGGRRVYAGYGYSIDNLAAAYLRGEDEFRQFVIELRSDPRDGRGL